MFVAHGPIAYIVNETIQKKKISKLNTYEHILVMILSIIFGILPDIDILILTLTDIPSFQHHIWFTHSILFYLGIWLVLNIFLKILKRILNKKGRNVLSDTFLNVIQWSFLIGTVSHLLADILFSYSRTLFPLTQQITILGGVLSTNYFASYFFTHSFAVEILFLSFFLLLIYREYIKKINTIHYLLYLIISLTLLYLPFTIYMNLNTYNKAAHMQNGMELKDADYDGISDRYDPDTNNNGRENIYEIDTAKMANFCKSISTGKYLVSNLDNSIEQIKYSFGAFNSYRVISQASYEQNLAIEAVLKEYAKDRYEIEGYTMNIPYSTLLYAYLYDKGTLNNLSLNEKTGNIFFVFEYDNVVNMGIIINDNSFCTVLPSDNRLVMHSREDIFDSYEGVSIKVVDILQLNEEYSL